MFNSKISGALDDLIAMKTGIQISNIPTKITEEATQAAEFRKKMAKEAQEGGEDDTGSSMYSPPRSEQTLRFPTDDQRFVDNWLVFRTLDRRIDAPHITGTVKDGEKDGASFINYRMASAGFVKPNDMVAQRTAKKTFKEYSGHRWNEGYTIALYFPNSVKDVISVEYETKEVGIGDTIINSLFGKGKFEEERGMVTRYRQGGKVQDNKVYGPAGDADPNQLTFGEAFAAAKRAGAKKFKWKGKSYTTETKDGQKNKSKKNK